MLIDLNRTMFFKASFDIEAQPGNDALWVMLMDLRGWLRGKANRDGYTMHWDNKTWSGVKSGDSIQNPDGSVRLNSRLHINGSALTWAGHLTEIQDPGNGCAPRQWVTEIGFAGETLERGGFAGETLERGRISIVLSYGDRPGFIGDLQPEPSPTIPLLVRNLLSDSRLTCSVKGAPLSMEAHAFACAQTAYDMIVDPQREIPVILPMPGIDGAFPLDPQDIAASLGPNAAVLYPANPQAGSQLNTLLSTHNLECRSGAVRIYDSAPQLDRAGEFSRHRFIPHKDIEARGAEATVAMLRRALAQDVHFWEEALPQLDRAGEFSRHRFIPHKDIEARGAEATVAMLRRALAQDVHFWEEALRLEDVQRLNRASTHERRIAQLKETYEDTALAEILSADERAEEAEAIAEQAMAENDALRKENRELESRCQSYELAFRNSKAANAGMGEALLDHVRTMPELPSTPDEVAKLALAAFSDRLDFSERGWKSLDDCEASPETLWQALHALATYAHPYFAGHSTEDPIARIRDNTPFRFARSEGMQTRKDPRLMALRDDTYCSRKISIEPHIASKNSDPSKPTFIRVYFAFDQPSGKIVIGDCGGHLDNYTTQSLH